MRDDPELDNMQVASHYYTFPGQLFWVPSGFVPPPSLSSAHWRGCATTQSPARFFLTIDTMHQVEKSREG